MSQAPVTIDNPITLNFAKSVWSQSVCVEMKWKRVTPKIMSMQNLKILIIVCKFLKWVSEIGRQQLIGDLCSKCVTHWHFA